MTGDKIKTVRRFERYLGLRIPGAFYDAIERTALSRGQRVSELTRDALRSHLQKLQRRKALYDSRS